ncbi:undecaprenyl-diphosphate phosphatase [Jatrophihabitans sp. YIM 134969]
MSDVSVGQSFVYGIVQGLTEFLPVSSTAHLRIVPALIGWDDPGAAYTAVIQLGTCLAILLYFWKELLNVTVGFVRGLLDAELRSGLEFRMGVYLILATIPVGVFGLVFSDQIETGARNLWLIAATLIVLALVLLIAERVGKRDRDEESLNVKDALAVGGAQALALIPGASRSGTTITAGLFRGLDRPTAARFSFLLSVPAVVLSGLFEARKIGDAGGAGTAATVIGIVVAFVVGLASIAWLMRWISRHGTYVFIVYRIALGLLLFGLLGGGVISAT